MSSRQLPNLGLKSFFALGEDNWNTDVDANFLKLSTLVQCAVKDAVASKPSSAQQGDVYLMNSSATSNANTVAVFDNGGWTHYAPQAGWVVYNLANDSQVRWNGTQWVELKLTNLRALGTLPTDPGLLEQTADSMAIRAIGVASDDDILSRVAADTRYSNINHTHPPTGVQSFNTRTGGVTLLDVDVYTAMGFTPVPTSANLVGLSGLTTATGLVEQTGTGTFSKRDIGVGTDQSVPTRADADTRYQALNGNLTALSGLTLTGNPGLVVKVNLTGDGFVLSPDIVGSGGGSTGTWGGIDGNLNDQTDLSLALGQKQQVSDKLTGLAAVPSTLGVVEQTAANTFAIRLIGATNATDLLTKGGADGIYQAKGTYQPQNNNLFALASLTSTAGLVEQTGANTFGKRTVATSASASTAANTDVLSRGAGDTLYATKVHTHPISDIVNLQATLTTIQTNVSTNTTNITNNATGIATNTTNIATNSTAITANTTAISNNESAITANASAISTLQTQKLDKPAVVVEATTARTIAVGDAYQFIRCTAATVITLPLDATAAVPVGASVRVQQAGAGQVSFVADGAAVIEKLSTKSLNAAAQGAVVLLVKTAADTWSLSGDLA